MSNPNWKLGHSRSTCRACRVCVYVCVLGGLNLLNLLQASSEAIQKTWLRFWEFQLMTDRNFQFMTDRRFSLWQTGVSVYDRQAFQFMADRSFNLWETVRGSQVSRSFRYFKIRIVLPAPRTVSHLSRTPAGPQGRQRVLECRVYGAGCRV